MIPEAPALYQGQTINLINGRWNQQASINIRNIERWDVVKLRVGNNSRASLVKEITHIHFANLTELRMYGNQIESVEELPRASMLRLEQLSLENNNIFSTRPVKKAHWLSLSSLNVKNNHISDSKNLTQACFPLKQLTLSEDGIFGGYDKNKFVDPWLVSKLQTSGLRYLSMKVKQFRISLSVRKVIQRKWKGTNIS